MMTFGFQWHTTDRCNLRCRHCYQDAFGPESERCLDDLKRMADRIFGALPDRTVSVNLTGGEPLLLPWLFELIGYLHSLPNVGDVAIITNGTIATDRVLDSMACLPKLTTLKVSIESADAATNDGIRGAGNLDRVLANLCRFKATGKDIVLMATLSRLNLAHVERTADLARGLGLSGVIFERFVPLGTGAGLLSQVLSPVDWTVAIRSVVAAAHVEADPLDLLSYKAFWLDTRPGVDEPLSGALCNLGDASMALMPDGTVYPCRRLPLPQGNVLSTPFPEILDRLSGFAPQAIRPRLSGVFCTSCGIEDCTGCRALARAVSGDPLADDPQCPLLAP